MKNQKGITLISLIVTIIILIILAALSISVFIKNGIIQKTEKAMIENLKDQYFEEIKLEILNIQIERENSDKTEAFIISLEENIIKKDWVSSIVKYNENLQEDLDKPYNNTILIIETKEGYEIIIDVNNEKHFATIREEHFVKKQGENKCKILYDANGGLGNVELQEVRIGFSIELRNNNFTKSGYIFEGWSIEKNANSEKIYKPGDKIKVESDILLYAQWTPIILTNPNISVTTEIGMPLLTEYGIIGGEKSVVKIDYDPNQNLINYYSEDEGVTWKEYVGEIETVASSIQAKSVFKDDEKVQTEIVTVEISKSTNGLPAVCYDDKDDTYYEVYLRGTQYFYLKIDDSCIGSQIRIKKFSWNNPNYKDEIVFLDSNKNVLESDFVNSAENKAVTLDKFCTIPNEAKWLRYKSWKSSGLTDTENEDNNKFYEIELRNEPIISAAKVYPIIKDNAIALETVATIKYYKTSVDKLYKIGDNEDWKDYNDNEKINIKNGEKLYAKGIDKNGKVTRIVSQSNLQLKSDAIGTNAYDVGTSKDTTNFMVGTAGTVSYYIDIDSSMINKYIRIKQYVLNNPNYKCTMYFIDKDSKSLTFKDNNNKSYTALTVSGDSDLNFLIPTGATKIKFTAYSIGVSGDSSKYRWRLYDISPINN